MYIPSLMFTFRMCEDNIPDVTAMKKKNKNQHKSQEESEKV